jgi:hypothetical protein
MATRLGRFGVNSPVDDADSDIWECLLKAIYDPNDDGVIASAQLDTGIALINGSRPFNEIRLTPKAASTGAEGTVFYCSSDNALYVATE